METQTETDHIVNAIEQLDIDLASITTDTKTKLAALAETIYGTDLASLSIDRIKNVIMLDLSSMPADISVSASEKRQTSVQYCSNDYFTSIRFDCSSYKDTVRIILNRYTNASQCLEEYFKLKAGFYSLMREKISTNEHFARKCLREAEARDGIAGQGRFRDSKD